MLRLRSNAFFLIFFGSLTAQPSLANRVEMPAGGPVECGRVRSFQGQLQILDSSRSDVLDLKKDAVIPCGGWVSVQAGAVRFKHKHGAEVVVGPNSFLSLSDGKEGRYGVETEHLLLYNGKILVEAKKSKEDFVVLTANSKATFTRGISLILYSPKDQSTQLVALTHPAMLSNRFEESKGVTAKAGEATSLDFGLLTVLPQAPLAVKVTSLKEALAGFPLSQSNYEDLLRVAASRSQRKFAASLTLDNPGARKTVSPEKYQAHIPMPDDPEAKSKWVSKVLGGGRSPAGKILYPKADLGEMGGKVVIKDLSPSRVDDREKKRVLEELSRIRRY